MPRPNRFFGLRLRRAATPALAVGGGFAILIWAKLRMVTGLPRSVYADPPVTPPPVQQRATPAPPKAPAPPAADAQNPRTPDQH